MSRAPLTLSREMKIGLIALMMLALLGGWLMVNNRQVAVDSAPTPVTTTPAPDTSVTGGSTVITPRSATDASTGTPTEGIPVAPGNVADSASEAVTAPPFPVTDANGSTPDPTVPTPLPSGINPDTPLLSLNGHNPFRPNELEVSDSPAQATTITASQPPSSSSVTISEPSSSASQINDALAASNRGAIPVSPVPVSPTRTTGSSSVIPIAPIPGTPGTASVPAPTIPTRATRPGGDAPASSASVPTPTPIGTRPVNVPSGTVSIPSGTGASTTGQPTGAPASPPVTAVREPSVTIPGALTPAANATGAATGRATSPNPSSTSVAQPTDPQAITDTAAPTAQNELDTFVKTHQLVFDAAVLGPVNTAIFRSDKGFMVVTAGQPLTDSRVMLKEVTASTATLALGQDTITLQLDKR